MGVLFGTDGIRMLANEELTCDLAMNVGKATAKVLTSHVQHSPKILIGKDTRLSGDMIENAISAGLTSMGANVELVGVVPTPAVAYLVKKYNADAGVMISASHNPAEYNGIKIFGSDGFKIPDEYENEIEKYILSESNMLISEKKGNEVGSCSISKSALEDYINFLSSVSDIKLDNIKVLVDCANGSASTTAEALFKKLDVNANIIYNTPDGININANCGSMYIENLGKKVVEGKYDLGLAFDGDADRLLAVDSDGNIVDGDRIMAILSLDMIKNNSLNNDTVVGTVMTNMGFIKFCEQNNINFLATKVGDRFVLEEIEKQNLSIGGEQSGHIILRNYHTTGDGQLAAVELLKTIKKSGKSLKELAQVMKKYPQVLKNLRATKDQKEFINSDEIIQNSIKEWEAKLADNGRILIRPSGTEPLIRIMVEGLYSDEINSCLDALVDVIQERISQI